MTDARTSKTVTIDHQRLVAFMRKVIDRGVNCSGLPESFKANTALSCSEMLITEFSSPGETTAVEKLCHWKPIEDGSLTYEPGCCREWWTKDEPGVELYPHCHWCGGKIEEVSDEEASPEEPSPERRCACGLAAIPEGELRVEVGPTTHRLAGPCFQTSSVKASGECQHDRFKPNPTLTWMGSTPDITKTTHRYRCKVCQGSFDLEPGIAQVSGRARAQDQAAASPENGTGDA